MGEAVVLGGNVLTTNITYRYGAATLACSDLESITFRVSMSLVVDEESMNFHTVVPVEHSIGMVPQVRSSPYL